MTDHADIVFCIDHDREREANGAVFPMRDADLVTVYLSAFLGWAANHSPNDAIAANTRRSAEAMCATAREEGRQEERERCAAEIEELRRNVIAFCAPAAVCYARDRGLPDGHLYAVHYDILTRCDARMDDFTRWGAPPLSDHPPENAERTGLQNPDAAEMLTVQNFSREDQNSEP
jgi:hypothetical protein